MNEKLLKWAERSAHKLEKMDASKGARLHQALALSTGRLIDNERLLRSLRPGAPKPAPSSELAPGEGGSLMGAFRGTSPPPPVVGMNPVPATIPSG